MKKKRTKDDNFWKFLIIFSIILNAINFYFVSGIYDILGGTTLDVPISNTAATGYFTLGQAQMTGMILFLLILAVGYAAYKKMKL